MPPRLSTKSPQKDSFNIKMNDSNDTSDNDGFSQKILEPYHKNSYQQKQPPSSTYRGGQNSSINVKNNNLIISGVKFNESLINNTKITVSSRSIGANIDNPDNNNSIAGLDKIKLLESKKSVGSGNTLSRDQTPVADTKKKNIQQTSELTDKNDDKFSRAMSRLLDRKKSTRAIFNSDAFGAKESAVNELEEEALQAIPSAYELKRKNIEYKHQNYKSKYNKLCMNITKYADKKIHRKYKGFVESDVDIFKEFSFPNEDSEVMETIEPKYLFQYWHMVKVHSKQHLDEYYKQIYHDKYQNVHQKVQKSVVQPYDYQKISSHRGNTDKSSISTKNSQSLIKSFRETTQSFCDTKKSFGVTNMTTMNKGIQKKGNENQANIDTNFSENSFCKKDPQISDFIMGNDTERPIKYPPRMTNRRRSQIIEDEKMANLAGPQTDRPRRFNDDEGEINGSPTFKKPQRTAGYKPFIKSYCEFDKTDISEFQPANQIRLPASQKRNEKINTIDCSPKINDKGFKFPSDLPNKIIGNSNKNNLVVLNKHSFYIKIPK